MSRKAMFAALAISRGWVAPTWAALIVNFSPSSVLVAPGGTTTIDVLISSDLLGGDPLAIFNLNFQISSPGATSGPYFSNLQPAVTFTSDPTYVFVGNNTGFSFNYDPGGINYANDNINGSDAYTGVGDVMVTTSRLLARLEISADPGSPQGVPYTIELLGTSTFEDSLNNPITVTSNSGTITATPEPSSIHLAGGLLVCLLGVAFWRYRTGKSGSLLQAIGLQSK